MIGKGMIGKGMIGKGMIGKGLKGHRPALPMAGVADSCSLKMEGIILSKLESGLAYLFTLIPLLSR